MSLRVPDLHSHFVSLVKTCPFSKSGRSHPHQGEVQTTVCDASPRLSQSGRAVPAFARCVAASAVRARNEPPGCYAAPLPSRLSLESRRPNGRNQYGARGSIEECCGVWVPASAVVEVVSPGWLLYKPG